jgi:hypothetical protein
MENNMILGYSMIFSWASFWEKSFNDSPLCKIIILSCNKGPFIFRKTYNPEDKVSINDSNIKLPIKKWRIIS